jgi:hypothetical protein
MMTMNCNATNIPLFNETNFSLEGQFEKLFVQILQQLQVHDQKLQLLGLELQRHQTHFYVIYTIQCVFLLCFFIFLKVLRNNFAELNAKVADLDQRLKKIEGVMGYCYEAALRSQLPQIAWDLWGLKCTSCPIPKVFHDSKCAEEFDTLNDIVSNNDKLQALRCRVKSTSVQVKIIYKPIIFISKTQIIFE